MKKNIPNQFKRLQMLCVAMFLFLTSMDVIGQKTNFSGKVVDEKGEALSGVNIVIKGTKKGTATDRTGKFSIEASKGNTLVISYISYQTREVLLGDELVVNVVLNESTEKLDEVIVTGLFDERKRLGASVSITTMNVKQMERLAPNSGEDLLRNVPGIFVNSSAGEVRSQVYTRGLANRPSYNDDVSGLYYISMQEDGLPISNIFLPTYTHDLFYRTDATLNRLEAVRGGTASIAGANAPGGIFNYLSKTGTTVFSGLVRQKFGLEGDGRNFYTRNEVNFGGPLANGWTYNVGGFYRHARGARDVGYPLNFGGQIKANVQKKYAKGTVTLYAKYLNDHNGTFLNLIGRNFDNPEIAPQFSNNDAFILPANASLSTKTGDGVAINYNPKDLNHSIDASFGMNWKHDLGNGFSISNNARFSHKELTLNITQATTPALLTAVPINGSVGTIAAGVGTITYRDNVTKQVLATVGRNTPAPVFTVLTNNLPNQNVIANSVLYQAAVTGNPKVNEFFDQVVLSKKMDKMSFNLGAFFGYSDVARFSQGAGGGTLSTLESQPRLLDVSVTAPNGTVRQITSPEGYFKVGGFLGYNDYSYRKINFAPFMAASWQITDKLNFDVGLRLENNVNQGSNFIRVSHTTADGGYDGNLLTTYDNNYFKDPKEIAYKYNNTTLSYSAAFNYLISEKQSIYARYSVGRKAPEANAFTGIDSDARLAITESIPQNISQVEIGYKLRTNKVEMAITPFYSLLSNIFTGFSSQDANGVLYALQPYYNSLETQGLEAEATFNFSNHFSTRVATTFQSTKFPQFKVSTAGPTTSKDDDTFFDYSGKNGDLTPSVMVNITPTYSTDKFYAMLTYSYIGDRWANAPNAFKLPAYSQFDLSLGYDLNKNLSLSANVNNLTNTVGIMTWGAPGGFPNTYARTDFSVAQKEANKDAYFPIGGTQPRSYFLTATYKF
ncbi:MAG: TonB-dependent receptor [Flectobacillus sp.]|nr:TonB-dependent receptor [Flectobacillus sp.]